MRASLRRGALVLSLWAGGVAAEPESMPGPGPRHSVAGTPVTKSRSCERCHGEIAAEWRESRHRQSYTNAEFQRSLARERPRVRAFCVNCHAPDTRVSGAPSRDQAEAGVSCVSCHVTAHGVLAGPARETSSERAPHALTRDAGFADAAACRQCHEFRFFDPRPPEAPEAAQWMQRTWREHYDSVPGDYTCASCHMPAVTNAEGKTHVSHAFPGSRDARLVRRALTVHAERVDDGAIELTLTPLHVTHAVPTGDLFRRLAVRAEVVGSGVAVERYLTRHQRQTGQGQRVEVDDDRPFARPRVLRLELGPQARRAPIRYEVRLERVDYLVRDDETRAVVSGFTEIAAGELP
jgi:nitrate reductase cytochrome c-type subunit